MPSPEGRPHPDRQHGRFDAERPAERRGQHRRIVAPSRRHNPPVGRSHRIPLPALAAGSIWAKISWGHWWLWSENQLVLFLVLFLFYAAYFMLRFSVDAGPQRANLSAVYALFGVVLVPVSFLAIRLAQHFIHPVVFTRHGRSFGGWILVAYCVAQAATIVLAYTLYRVELAGKRLDARLRELREVLA